MKNKKAILMGEFLRILIAVLCIALLVYLAFGLYNLFVKKTAIEQARETLKQLIAKADGMKEGEEGIFIGSAPAGWYFVSYDSSDLNFQPPEYKISGYRQMPSLCNNRNCICMCPETKNFEIIQGTEDIEYIFHPFYYSEYSLKRCDEGVCVNPQTKIIISNEFFKTSLNEYGRFIYTNWISLFKVPKQVYMKKINGGVILSGNNPKGAYINNLLSREIISDKGTATSFENYLKIMVLNNCAYTDSNSKKFSVSSESEKVLESTLKDYFKEIKENTGFNAFFRIMFIGKDRPEIWKDEYFSPSWREVGDKPVIEIRQICNEDFTIYIKLEVGK